MCAPRLKRRTASARFVSIGRLDQYSLRFHKLGLDGSGKADAYYTGQDEDHVWGVVFELNQSDKQVLDQFESLGVGYDQKEIFVDTLEGSTIQATIYCARSEAIRRELNPFSWYLWFLISGANQFGLPSGYVANLRQVKSIVDSDQQRDKLNHDIANSSNS
jgi:hypothetical protein